MIKAFEFDAKLIWGLVQKAAISGNTWSKRRSTQVMVTRCWSNLDHHLGFVHNSWHCCNLRWRAGPGGGLARARTPALSRLLIGTSWHQLLNQAKKSVLRALELLGRSVSHRGASWHQPARTLPRFEPCRNGLSAPGECVAWKRQRSLNTCSVHQYTHGLRQIHTQLRESLHDREFTIRWT